MIDGDLCEMFNSMDPVKQKSVSEELDRTPSEVSTYFGKPQELLTMLRVNKRFQTLFLSFFS